jgi:hypothetical protein
MGQDEANQAPPAYSYAPNQLFYVAAPVPFAPSPVAINETEVDSLVHNNQGSACQRRFWGCRRNNQTGGCCWKDDNRPFGTFQHFAVSLFFGTVAPLLSIIMAYGMETSSLSRIGVIFGTANSLFLATAGLIAWAIHDRGQHPVLVHFGLPLVFGFIFLVIAMKSWRRFLYFYRTRETKAEEEKVRVISQTGSCTEFAITFFVSLILPVIGVLISIIARKNSLLGRYGALSGFGFCLIVLGVLCTFQGMPPAALALGLFIMELSLVHFRRAIVCAESVTPVTHA